ncbi:hypothetical protein OE88DRAFT_1334691 [Heliocybe sulcata]|uniref:Yeast cell wall synthesis Kre9/Knh1-like N-terminal domain-containing protein n=1 Tax=Heliocybe sulcata TaxID=5364 RepID=A0A5C3N8A6_9AGAM|nr:hypothetical protein OE88DRAFT_1334691 [Heliocybe sulcata]
MVFLYHILAFTVLCTINIARAELYVASPAAGSTCHAGQPCTVTWLDNGEVPLLSSLGACTVGLYTGSDELLQEIEPVNPASTLSLQFTPNAAVGPNGDGYYVRFQLDGMSGSTPTQISSLTSTVPVASSVSSPTPQSVTSTSTIGTISLPSLSSSSLASTATIPSSRTSSSSLSTSLRSSASSTSPAASSSPSSSGTSSAPTLRSDPMLCATALLTLLSLYMFC